MSDIFFRLQRLNPDRRQFQQQTIELVPDEALLIRVEAEHSRRAEDAAIIITPEVLKNIADMFEKLFNAAVEVEVSGWEDPTEDDGWPEIDEAE